MKDPTHIKDLLGDVLAGMGVADPAAAVALLDQWDEMAPSPWRERSTPVSLLEGVLEVEVADGATASLLRYQERQLVAHLGAGLGSGLVTEVKIRVARH